VQDEQKACFLSFGDLSFGDLSLLRCYFLGLMGLLHFSQPDPFLFPLSVPRVLLTKYSGFLVFMSHLLRRGLPNFSSFKFILSQLWHICKKNVDGKIFNDLDTLSSVKAAANDAAL
jgi:hypothetical protein